MNVEGSDRHKEQSVTIMLYMHSDSPTGGGDYITPLKKRRLARESMSSELSSTPPSTPVHSTSLEEDKMVEEVSCPGIVDGVG